MKENKCSVIILSILILCILLLTYWVKIGYTKDFDNFVYNLFEHNELLNIIMIGITSFGGVIGLILITVLLLFVIPNKKIIALLSINLSVISILNELFKNIICRPRPIGIALTAASGYSFPSGHSSGSLAFYGLLIYFVYKNMKNKKIKCSLIVALCILILLIGLSRIYLGVHYASDVLGGYIFGLIYLIIFINLLKLRELKGLKTSSKSLK